MLFGATVPGELVCGEGRPRCPALAGGGGRVWIQYGDAGSCFGSAPARAVAGPAFSCLFDGVWLVSLCPRVFPRHATGPGSAFRLSDCVNGSFWTGAFRVSEEVQDYERDCAS